LAKTLIVYYTMFGNTEKLTKALAAGLKSSGVDAEISKVDAVKAEDLVKADLLCIGSPVHAWSDSKPVKDLLEHLKSVDGLKRRKAFAFDTKMSYSRLAGSATGKIESKLKELGLTIVKPGESAAVKGREGPLEEGAEERFNRIGAELARTI
jgi:flavorubredoxin